MREQTLLSLVQLLSDSALAQADVIPWGCPIPAFGDPARATVATLGLNPSNREFMDCDGRELDGSRRRFHTLQSLRLRRWSDANDGHLEMIAESCRAYFAKNPYDGWFRRLDSVISGTQTSFYPGVRRQACHLDLIPYATASKWSSLTGSQRSALLGAAGGTLGELLRDSSVRVLILNGASVVMNFAAVSGVTLTETPMQGWTLPRGSGDGVRGVAYRGLIEQLSGHTLRAPLLVLGYNHNLQSSFGVTKGVLSAIQRWITESVHGEGLA